MCYTYDNSSGDNCVQDVITALLSYFSLTPSVRKRGNTPIVRVHGLSRVSSGNDPSLARLGIRSSNKILKIHDGVLNTFVAFLNTGDREIYLYVPSSLG